MKIEDMPPMPDKPKGYLAKYFALRRENKEAANAFKRLTRTDRRKPKRETEAT